MIAMFIMIVCNNENVYNDTNSLYTICFSSEDKWYAELLATSVIFNRSTDCV